jgi:hypothetical protein
VALKLPSTRATLGLVVVAAVVGAVTVGVLLAGRWISRLPVGLTSRWHVPGSTIHDGLRYRLAKPVRCESPKAIERSLGISHLRRVAPDGEFSRFTASSFDRPVHLWLAPKDHSCLVAYYQFQEVD